jgi:hypothetical protein
LTRARPLRLVLNPSPGFAATILGVHALAAASLWISFPGRVAAVIALLVAVLGCVTAWDRALLRGRRSVRALEIGGPEDVLLEFSDGTRRAARSPRRRHVSRFGVGLRLVGLRRRSLFVWAGMLDPVAARRLRLWALWGRVPGNPWESFPA